MHTPHDPKTTPADKDRAPETPAEDQAQDRNLKNDDQRDTAEPQPGEGAYQGGGIEDAIGGGQSGQGGG